MTFQGYLDTIRAKTGLSAEEFRRLAVEKGLLAEGVKSAAIIAWLKEDFGLGRGHGMALVATFRDRPVEADRIEQQFAGPKAHWKPIFERLLAALDDTGPVEIAPTATYISLLKGQGKFAILSFTSDRMDVGIKLKDAPTTERFEASGTWNSMVTHRVRVTDPAQVDAELCDWLRRAYAAA